MIQFADNQDVTELKSIWKICFGDSDEYINLIFTKKFKPENTLVYLSDGKIVASLQMQEYNIRIYDSILPFYYMVGLCTLPAYRGRGYMGQLIEKSFDILKERKIPISILVPAEDSLIDYYNRFGYEETFDKGNEKIELKKILNENKNIKNAYNVFDRLYQHDDFCVLKSKDDFEVIVKDYIEDDYPPRYNLRAMSKIIDQKEFLSIYAKKNKSHQFIVKTKKVSSKKDVFYFVNNDNVSEVYNINEKENIIDVSERYFTKILFGYKTKENNKYTDLFDEHSPIINLMLE